MHLWTCCYIFNLIYPEYGLGEVKQNNLYLNQFQQHTLAYIFLKTLKSGDMEWILSTFDPRLLFCP